MKKIMFVVSVILMFVSCEQDVKLPKDNIRCGYSVSFDTIKVADSTYVVNVVYQKKRAISVIKLCVINK